MKKVPRRQLNKKSDGKRLYTVPELIKLSGLSRRKIEYWAEIGLLKPSMRDVSAKGSQPATFYSQEAVVRALIICDLRNHGFTPSQVYQVASNLKLEGIKLNDPNIYLLTDGYSVYYANNDNDVIDILKHNRQRLLLIPVHEQVERLRAVA